MQIVTEEAGQQKVETREIYEIHMHLANAPTKNFTLGNNGLNAIGISNGVVNLQYDNGDMHSIFVGSSDTVYAKHRRVEEPMIIVPDMVDTKVREVISG